ncbi:rhamnulokinase [Cellulosimicrobium marinum]|uniref:rhamnulokinase n=1 Tax=Cellulosimicrobium marinum TaxID=1638992 RepID=UPI001E2E9DE4|nr:rhamnulokinase family protein [Cellulosimicrobium marinum]MCB7135324.1 rhamnulokinase [Cellulosimicrobium marinum]
MRRRSGAVAAVDLGATSGRVIVGHLDGPDLRLRHVARFPNEPVRTRDGLHWDLLGLYRSVLDGLAAAEREDPGAIGSVGIDSWAVDYGLLRDGRLLGLPYHYRDDRTAAGVERVHARVDPAALYARNGLQHLPFTTLFQLATEGPLLDVADRVLLVPDLLAHWLTGAEVAERTNASTTGLLDPRTGEWDRELVRRVGLPERILPPLVDPGADLGRLTPDVAALVGRDVPLVAVGSHDTASAVVAVPADGDDVAFVSCGTWGLVGLELDAPVVAEQARLAGFTNEGGVDGRTRFLHNVMGLWLLSESIRTWDRAATAAQRSSTLQELLGEAAAVRAPVTLFDVDDPRFLAPGDIPARIADWCREHDRPVPGTRGEVVRSIVESLAQAFADAVHDAARLAGRTVSAIHVVGGGAQNTLLCQATADRAGLPVLAGPVEATAIGNVLVQARAAGLVTGGLKDLRAVVRATTAPTRYAPRPTTFSAPRARRAR